MSPFSYLSLPCSRSSSSSRSHLVVGSMRRTQFSPSQFCHGLHLVLLSFLSFFLALPVFLNVLFDLYIVSLHNKSTDCNAVCIVCQLFMYRNSLGRPSSACMPDPFKMYHKERIQVCLPVCLPMCISLLCFLKEHLKLGWKNIGGGGGVHARGAIHVLHVFIRDLL